MIFTFLRHGKTAGNLQRRYIGVTDEPLCPQGKQELRQRALLPVPSALYISPMKRCVETAAILFPGVKPRLVPDCRECDFGELEGKNYAELNGSPAYQRFIDSMGMEIPGGEGGEAFRERCCRGFLEVAGELIQTALPDAAIVCHGGTIMAIMERFERRKMGFYGYQVKNGRGYRACWDGESLSILEEI